MVIPFLIKILQASKINGYRLQKMKNVTFIKILPYKRKKHNIYKIYAVQSIGMQGF